MTKSSDQLLLEAPPPLFALIFRFQRLYGLRATATALRVIVVFCFVLF